MLRANSAAVGGKISADQARSKTDLQTLTDIPNGIVHAAEDAEVEERVLTAFVQHAEALLTDLGRARGEFWNGQLGVVDVLLKDASDKLAHVVGVRLAAATAVLERRYATEGDAVIQALRTLSKSQPVTSNQHFHACPSATVMASPLAGTTSDGRPTTGTGTQATSPTSTGRSGS